MEVRFYRCNHCGNIALMVHDSGVNPVCCGDPMQPLAANSTDADTEKHIPAISRVDERTIRVEIGSKPHPMTEEHHIEWICLAQDGRIELRYLTPGEAPVADFCGDGHATVWAYCNLHGLWRAEF